MKKTLLLFFCLLGILFYQQVLAQLPEVSTAENPKWYYIQVQGSDSDRKDRLFTNESNKVYGREKTTSASPTELDKQLWRFEKNEKGNYVIINKSALRQLDITYDSSLSVVKGILNRTSSTDWKITAKGSYYNIEAGTPLADKTTYKYAHQANNYNNRNYPIIMETSTWMNSGDSYFKFVEYVDPNPIVSDDSNVVWYYIKSAKTGLDQYCISDLNTTATAKYGVKLQTKDDYSQHWKLVKSTTFDDHCQLVNRKTGSMINTDVIYDGYYYTQSTNNASATDGWEVTYIGQNRFEISGMNKDGFVRYLNATSTDAPAENYSTGTVQTSGFAWVFENVETASYPSSGVDKNISLTSIASATDMIETLPTDTKYTPSTASATSFNSGEGLDKSYDGNMSTLYHSHYTTTKFPVTLTYNFTDVPCLDYLIYHPRTSGDNGKFKELEIWYTTKDGERTKLGDYDFEGNGSAATVTFDSPLINPVSIEFIVQSGVGGFASCAEMEFYASSSDLTDIYSLFEDKLLTKLKPGVTLTDIKNLNNLYIRDLAMALYKNQYSLDFRYDEYKAFLNMTEFKKLTNITTYSKFENPTGIFLSKGKHLVMVDNIKDTPVNIIIPKYENQVTTMALPSKTFALKNGLNIINVGDWDGLGYISYYSAQPNEEEPVKIHIVNGPVQGYFDSSKHNNDDWVRLLANADKYVVMDMLGTYSQIAFPVSDYKTYAPKKGVELISAYDTIVKYEQRFYGYEKYNKQIKNHVLWRVNYNYYAYKDDNGCSFMNTYMSSFANPNRLNPTLMANYEGWTIPHELGHVHQFDFFNWHGMTEVTVNLPNFYLQHQMKYTSSRFPVSVYQNAYDDIVVPQVAHASYFGDNYNYKKGIVFAQLYHYFAEKGNEDFYPDLFEALRNTTGSTTSWTMPDYEMNFAEKACDVSGLDLIPFFEKWGFFYYTNADGRSAFTVEDYGGKKTYSLSKTKVADFKEKMKAKNYAEAAEDITLVLPNGKRMKPQVGIDNILNNNRVYVQDGYIVVEGTDDYIVRNISGMIENRNSRLAPGVYLVTIDNETTKVLVK